MNRYFLATNDVELTSIKFNKQRRESGRLVMEEGLPKLLSLYDKYSISATFFVTGDIAEEFPAIPRMIVEAGHELASHSYSHQDSYALDTLSLQEQVQQINKSKKILEDIGGCEVVTFRAPALRVNEWTPQALQEAGFIIDSSISPQRADMFLSFGAIKKINRIWAARKPGYIYMYDMNRRGDYGIFEIPISALIIPYIGTMLRISPFATNLLKHILNLESKISGQPINFLIHPNECFIEDDSDVRDRRAKNPLSYLFAEKIRGKLKLKNLGSSALDLYESQLHFFRNQGYRFVTCKEYYTIWKNNHKQLGDSMLDALKQIVNTVRENKGLEPLKAISPENDLRTDIGFDSLDLAELTVRIEKETGVDVFADSFVNTIGDILVKISK